MTAGARSTLFRRHLYAAQKIFKKYLIFFVSQTRAFAVIITKNEALRILEHEKRHEAASDDETLKDSIDHADESAEETAFRGITAHELSLLIEQLDDKYKNVIYLRYYNSFSMNEIASALGITVETAKKRAQRALAMLRSMSESNG